jgi:hypothetical protein
MNSRFFYAMGAYAVLGLLAFATLNGNMRLVVWLFLGLFAVKTVLAMLRQREEESASPEADVDRVGDYPSGGERHGDVSASGDR